MAHLRHVSVLVQRSVCDRQETWLEAMRPCCVLESCRHHTERGRSEGPLVPLVPASVCDADLNVYVVPTVLVTLHSKHMPPVLR